VCERAKVRGKELEVRNKFGIMKSSDYANCRFPFYWKMP